MFCNAFGSVPAKLSDGAEGWQMGPVTYPEGERQVLAFQKQPLSVFTGKVRLQALVSSEEKTPSTPFTVPLEIRLQACNDQVCLAPETVTLSLSPPRS
jgi:hypothetical protein